MKIAIIGCGYVGSAIARVWSQQGHTVTATTTTPEKIPALKQVAGQVVVVKGSDRDKLAEVVADNQAILVCIGASDRNSYRETYLETAKNLVSILQNNSTVEQLIYTGSYAILGDRQGDWVDESCPISPTNENGEILRDTENILLSAQSDRLKVCILRLAGIYGTGRELIKIFKSWSAKTLPGDGKDYSNWVHFDDIIAALALVQSQQLDGIYHLADDTPLPRQEFFDRLFQTHQLEGVSWDASQPPSRSYNLRLSNQKIKVAGLQLMHPETEF